jgi:hypothetical protein
MSKAKLVAAGLAAVQVLAEWSAELSGFRETEYGIWNTEHGTWNTDYYINIMYTIDTMVKHRSAKRATKRSAKRAAKRGAYKSKRTHRKMKLSRKRMQRGGQQTFIERLAAGKAAAAAAIREKADKVIANLLASSTEVRVDTLVILIKTVQSLQTMFQIVRTIAEISNIVGEEKKAEMKTKLNKQIEDLKVSMNELTANEGLDDCFTTLQDKVQRGDVVVQEPQSSDSDVGKTGVFHEDGNTYYKALVVGDSFDEEGNRVLKLWLNGAGIEPIPIQYYKVSSTVKFVVDENDSSFKDAKDKYGQSPVTIEDARIFYKIPAPGAGAIPAPGAVAETQSSPEEEGKSIFEQLKELFTKFISSPASDRKQTLLDMISGLKSKFLDNLNRFSNRLQDKELKECIKQINKALTEKIRKKLESLGFKSTSSPAAPVSGNGGVGGQTQVRKIKITRNVMNNRGQSFAQFTAFENELREHLKSKGWSQDDTQLDKQMEAYINHVIRPEELNFGEYTIFIFAVLSGMIDSIEFINDAEKPAKKVKIANKDDFMKRYDEKRPGARRPYYKFKYELETIIASSNTYLAFGLVVTFTTDFSKTPLLPSIQTALKAVYVEANTAYDAAVKSNNADVIQTAFLVAHRAANAAKNIGVPGVALPVRKIF